MAEILSTGKIGKISKNFKKEGKTIVLAGGCFDILHPGHVIFLEKAKKQGDILIVLLESDEKVKHLKGVNRPVYTQKTRAKVLAALRVIDCVVMLPMMKNDPEYDELIGRIKPDVIAATSNDVNVAHHKRAAKLVGAKLKLVTRVIGNHSTSSLVGSTDVQ